MVKVKTPRRETVCGGELVQFVQGSVTDEVGPEGVVSRPHRGIDEHGHDGKSTKCDTGSSAFVRFGAMK
ncbi:hypothetical protein GCM10011313_07190 [Mycetocola zhadangensis]|nr:hypothetical protein GCM10011313_07190 [Mycetocola zhadangensis]